MAGFAPFDGELEEHAPKIHALARQGNMGDAVPHARLRRESWIRRN